MATDTVTPLPTGSRLVATCQSTGAETDYRGGETVAIWPTLPYSARLAMCDGGYPVVGAYSWSLVTPSRSVR